MPVCSCEHHLDACVAGVPPLRHVLDGGGCVEIGIDAVDSNTIDFETAGGLTATAILDPDVTNVLEMTASGLRVLRQIIPNHSGYDNYLVNNAGLGIKQGTSLTLPSGGNWFVQAWWSAWAEKDTDEVSDISSRFSWAIEIAGTTGPERRWNWGVHEGLLGNKDTRISLTDNWGHVVAGNQTFNVNIRLARNNAGADNNVQVSGSIITAIAYKSVAAATIIRV